MNKALVIKLLRQLADAFEAEESGAEVERGEESTGFVGGPNGRCANCGRPYIDHFLPGGDIGCPREKPKKQPRRKRKLTAEHYAIARRLGVAVGKKAG